jgi:two-component system, sensor histidine kinase and response regulator
VAKILIVDDELDTCRVMSRLFARWGWACETVHEPAKAVAAVRANRPDAVLLDVMMPGIDGFQILAAIRADADVASVPVLFYSALHDQKTLERAFAAGADDYIPKLTSAKQIRERVALFVPGEPGSKKAPKR